MNKTDTKVSKPHRTVKRVKKNNKLITTPHNTLFDALTLIKKEDLTMTVEPNGDDILPACEWTINYNNNKIEVKFLNKVIDSFSFGTSAHKLLLVLMSELVKKNKPKQKSNLDKVVRIPMKTYAKLIGADIYEHKKHSEEEQAKEAKRAKTALYNVSKQASKDLDTLNSMIIHFETSNAAETKKGKYNFHFADTGIETDKRTKNMTIVFFFSDVVASFLLGIPFAQLPPQLLTIDGNHETAYCIGYKLTTYYCILNNIIKGTNDHIKVENVLKATKLQDYETVMSGKQRNWKRLIKDKVEDALDLLVQMQVISNWEYVGAGTKPLSTEDFIDLTYTDWSKMYIKFQCPYNVEVIEENAHSINK